MNKPFLPVPKILVATFAGISFASVLVAPPSLANPNQPFATLETDKNSNSIFGNGSDFNMFNLIHQANFGTLNWNSEQQNQQLNDAAAAFKARQQKLLQSQQQPNPNSPTTTSPTTSGENAAPLINLPASDQ
ncbi:hypothetical protein H5968_21295 [Sphaerospermopsis sp. LEGE 00249]|uniref:hypothetical protein n=1 Tax=Sphaerospermopsis sp. LEGE 00249 TaxID=1380707 RepID=UPI00164D4280|nr:hypothetical protein [Sphaerospermopsis sp. LEGE 00249]MBC5797613.1 hypothetical protein [Sphaerospermopsis sp. LEGE 00249]